MSDFRFAEIGWLNAAWAVLLCAGLLVALEFRGRSLLDRIASPLMQLRLVQKTSLLRRLLGISLFALSLLTLVFALMRPQWGMTVQQLTRVDSQIMICLDVSKSMLAEDVVPNRLERAKTEIDTLLGLMDDGQQVGLTAFAGKASVMCPMTTDFGFLRLILQEVQPTSVGLGGTRIGEAIQKAVSGFKETGDVNRLILLITDGEDHDSFPLDAAEQAKNKGVRIVSIGFGDEAGSKIEITDPQTGIRSYVKDRNGVDVVSSLDGETLRDIALRTEGAYIPAGTGALDLQSIYDSHIRTLLKGNDTQEERVIRNEAYQWCVLAALVLLVGSLMAPNAFAKSNRAGSTALASSGRSVPVGVLAMAIATSLSQPLSAQDAASSRPAQAASDNAFDASDQAASAAGGDSGRPSSEPGVDPAAAAEETESESDSAPEAELAPRETYNLAIKYISSDPDRAERMLTTARQNAGIDGELRYRTLYNLGWVEVNRADALLNSEPEQALQRLELAASRFREAIRVRSESDEARYNLELISRRILELRDSLAQKNPQDLAQRLDSLIEAQRGHQAKLQEQTSLTEAIDANDSEVRSLFRRLGVEQRQILSDMQKLAEDARQEVDALRQNKDDQSSGESQVRAAQLSAMLGYLDEGIQRMNKSRSFTRRMQSERAFIRWAAALSASKRARDQLRNPVEVLGVLVGDASDVARLTGELAASQHPQLSADPAEIPPWLTTEYLGEAQAEMTERTGELRDILSAGLAAQSAETAGSDANSDAAPDEQTAELLESIRAALPSIENSVSSFGKAQEAIEQPDLGAAYSAQSEGIVALMDAAEFFFDLRRLIEAMYRDELMVQGMVKQLGSPPEGELPLPLVSATADLQTKNLDRAARLDKLLDKELARLAQASQASADPSASAAAPAPPPGSNAGAGTAAPQPPGLSPEQLQSQKQRFDIAKQILDAAQTSMRDVNQMLTSYAERASEKADSGDSNSSEGEAPTAPVSGEEQKEQAEQLTADSESQTASSRTAGEGEAAGESSGSEASDDASGVVQVEVPQAPETPAPETPASETPTESASTPSESEPAADSADDTPLLDLALDNSLTTEAAEETAPEPLPTASVDQAVASIEDLRRLFFSLVEHLRETAQRQAELNDNVVQQAAGVGTKEVGALQTQQAELQTLASDISAALREQAAQAKESSSGSGPGNVPPQSNALQPTSTQDATVLAQAADLVTEGSQAMQLAADSLQDLSQAEINGRPTSTADETTQRGDAESDPTSDLGDAPEQQGNEAAEDVQLPSKTSGDGPSSDTPQPATPDFSPTMKQQQDALEKLAEALALLDDQQSGQNQNPQQNQQQNQEQSQQDEQSQDQANKPPQNMNANQMLQAIRDREAERRREKNNRSAASAGGVERDW